MSLSKETVLWRLSAGTELESSNGQLFRKRAPFQVDGISFLAFKRFFNCSAPKGGHRRNCGHSWALREMVAAIESLHR